ncbi:DUF3426 domain-containing protein [Lautropia mirabilis]
MALATTCPQCKTSFKVVPDQLKLRRGLVRCGVCQHVFSGVEHLRYVDRDEDTSQPDTLAAPTITTQPPAPAVTAPANSTPRSGADASPSHTTPAADDDPVTDTLTSVDTATDTGTADGPSTEAPAADDQDTSNDGARRASNDRGRRRGRNRNRDNRAGRNGSEAPRAAPAPRPTVTQEEDDVKTVFFLSDSEEPLPGQSADDNIQLPASLRSGNTAPQPNDIDPDTRAAGALIDEANRIWRQHKPRHADGDDDKGSSRHGSDYSGASDSGRTGSRTGHSRRSRRHGGDSSAHSGQRTLVGWLTPARRRYPVIGLSVLAAVQLVSVHRTEIAYHLPFLRPVASVASLLTGQDIKPPMSLGALSIESFELRNTRQPGKTRMTAILRNRSKLPTRWPAMELTLTGPSNAVVVRKVLLPSQYPENPRAQAGGMPPNSEQPIDLLLETSDLNLAGYSVALFYP